MTPTEFLTCRSALNLTQSALASTLGVGRRAVQYWEAGEREVPEPVARILRLAQTDPSILARLAAAE